MMCRGIVTGSLIVIMLTFGSIGGVRAGEIEDGAKIFIEGLADKAIASLADKDASRDQREQKFRVLLNDYFAVRTIGRWVLGRYWRKAKKSEQEEYLTLFEDLMVVMYLDRFGKYAGEKLSITKTVLATERDVIVYSQIVSTKSSDPIHADWRVRYRGDDNYKIVDVMVEGISMGQTQRSEFGSVVRKNGGKVSGLIDELRHRIEAGT